FANISGGTDNITVQVIHMLDGQKLPKSLINKIPEGAINKQISKRVSSYDDNSRTRELPSLEEYQNYHVHKKKHSSNSIYFGLLIIPILIAVYFFFFYGDDDRTILNSDKSEFIVSLSEKPV